MALWNYTAVNSPIEVVQATNTLTGGLFGVTFLVLLWLVLFMKNRDQPNRENIAGITFITCIVALFLRLLSLINDWTFGVCVVLMLGSIVILINKPTY